MLGAVFGTTSLCVCSLGIRLLAAQLPRHPCQVVLSTNVAWEDHISEPWRASLRATSPDGNPRNHCSSDLGTANTQGTNRDVVRGDAAFGHKEGRWGVTRQHSFDHIAEGIIDACPNAQSASAVVLQHLSAPM